MKDEDLLGLPDEESFLRAIPRAGSRPDPRRRYPLLYPLLALLAFVSLAPLSVLAWRFVTTNREGDFFVRSVLGSRGPTP